MNSYIRVTIKTHKHASDAQIKTNSECSVQLTEALYFMQLNKMHTSRLMEVDGPATRGYRRAAPCCWSRRGKYRAPAVFGRRLLVRRPSRRRTSRDSPRDTSRVRGAASEPHPQRSDLMGKKRITSSRLFEEGKYPYTTGFDTSETDDFSLCKQKHGTHEVRVEN